MLRKIWKKARRKKKTKKILAFARVFIFLLLLESAYFIAKNKFEGRLPLGISIANAEYSFTPTEIVESELAARIEQFMQQAIAFKYGNEVISVLPHEIDLRVSNLRQTLLLASNDLISFCNLPLPIEFNEKRLEKILKAHLGSLSYDPTNAKVFLNDSGELEILKENAGRKIELEEITKALKKQASGLAKTEIEISSEDIPPKILSAELIPYQESLKKIIAQPLVLKETEYSRYDVDLANRLDWFEFGVKYFLAGNEINIPNKNYLPVVNGKNAIFLDRKAFAKFVETELDPLLAKLPQPVAISQTPEGGFAFEGVAMNGRRVDEERLFELVSESLEKGEREITIPFKLLPAPVKVGEKLEQEGIKELVGEAITNYTGSPLNRQHNIRIASEKLNGLVLKPGEEFSFIGSLGPVTHDTGYLNELVISKGELLAEVGGGVCQVSTTVFRAALNAGLDVVEQKPHSLKVHYYSPPGLDATIYPKQSDLRFVNNYATPVLMQTHVEGETLRINFFGSKDGRVVELSGPFYPDGNPITNLNKAGLKMFWDYKLVEADGQETEKKYEASYRLLPKE